MHGFIKRRHSSRLLNFSGIAKGDGTDLLAAVAGSDYQTPVYPVVLEHQATSGTNGGTFTSGAWQTRTINTKASDPNNLCSLSSNQFVLLPGTYIFWIEAPAYYVDAHQAKLYNVTDAVDIKLGTTVKSSSANTGGVTNASVVVGNVTISGSKTLEVRHRCVTTRSTDGFGQASSFGTEVYLSAFFLRIG